jgi:spore coat polysaccharide biosynthesis protein SpsF
MSDSENSRTDGKQLQFWRGQFGDAYIERNAVTPERIIQRNLCFGAILRYLRGERLGSVLEIGANIGLNLRALRNLTEAELWAVEPNGRARETLLADGVVARERLADATADALPFADGAFDLAFTATVLIHVPEDAIAKAIGELCRVTRRYVLCLEYFAPVATEVRYRGHDDLLWKRDYGGMIWDAHPELELVADGFFWKRTTGLDNVNWWLFRKPVGSRP